MSSNTLRGLGREGSRERPDPSQEARDRTDDGGGAVQADGRSSEEEPTAPALPHSVGDPNQTKKMVVDGEGTREPAQAASLDAPVPGTGSLDGSVPDSRPSLDGKTPSLAVTLIGIPPPSLVKKLAARDQGTMQGRDVHLPTDLQRLASVRPVAGPSPPAAASADRSAAAPPPAHAADSPPDHASEARPKSEKFDPARTVRIASPLAEGTYIHGHAHEQVDVSSHSPWYDQEPHGDDNFDDPAPNLLGRVAIGAAVAAALAVVLFAVVRLHGQGIAEDEAEVKPLAAPVPIVSHDSPPPPGAAPDPAAASTSPSALPASEPLPGDLPSRLPATGAPETAPAAGLRGSDLEPFPDLPPIAAPGSRTNQPGSANPVSAQAKRKLTPAAASASSPRPSTSMPGANPSRPFSADPTFSSVPSAVSPARSEPTESVAPAPPSSSNVGRPAGTDKPRGKANYDPDSTLPLNLE